MLSVDEHIGVDAKLLSEIGELSIECGKFSVNYDDFPDMFLVENQEITG